MKTLVGLLLLIIAAFSASALPSFRPRIAGGFDAPEGKYPHHVSLWVVNIYGEKSFYCGGSIINDRYILTAAHCVQEYDDGEIQDPREMAVGVGSQLLNETTKFYNAEKLIPHSQYDPVEMENDIALMRLDEKIVYTDKIQPISLPTEDLAEEKYVGGEGHPIMLSGWGRLKDHGSRPNTLQEIELQLFDLKKCREKHSVGLKQICTLNKKGEGMCSGDSGGPLVRDGTQIGVVSYSFGPCANGRPNVFARVYSYLDWIEQNMHLD